MLKAFESKDEDPKYACLVVYLSIIDLFTYLFIYTGTMDGTMNPCITKTVYNKRYSSA